MLSQKLDTFSRVCTPGTINRGDGEGLAWSLQIIHTLAAGFLHMIAYPGPWLQYILSLYALINVSNMFSATKHKYFLNVLVFSCPFMANIVINIFAKHQVQMNKCRLLFLPNLQARFWGKKQNHGYRNFVSSIVLKLNSTELLIRLYSSVIPQLICRRQNKLKNLSYYVASEINRNSN